MMEKDGVRFASVRSPQQNCVGVFDFAIGTRPATCSEDRRQTGDAGGVSSTVAAIDIVCAHYAAYEFLRGIIQFVGGLRAAEHAKIPRIILRDRLLELLSDAAHGFIPGGGTMRTVLAHQRLGQASFREFRHKTPGNAYQKNRNTLSLNVLSASQCSASLPRRTVTEAAGNSYWTFSPPVTCDEAAGPSGSA